MTRLFVGLIAMLGSLFFATPATATDSTETQNAPAEVSAWFREVGPGIVREQGAEAFPEEDAADIERLNIGEPVRAWLLPQDIRSGELEPTHTWVAPIVSGDNAVGVLTTDFSTGQAGDAFVYGDPRLGTEAADRRADRILIQAPELDGSWFVLSDDKISPANEAGASQILGEIPIADFRAQIARATTSDTKPTSEVSLAQEPEPGPSIVQIVIMTLVVIAVITVSLLWLRWDQEERQDRQDDLETEGASKLHTRRARDKARVPFKESAGTVEVYERPKSSRGDDDDNDPREAPTGPALATDTHDEDGDKSHDVPMH